MRELQGLLELRRRIVGVHMARLLLLLHLLHLLLLHLLLLHLLLLLLLLLHLLLPIRRLRLLRLTPAEPGEVIQRRQKLIVELGELVDLDGTQSEVIRAILCTGSAVYRNTR